MLVTHPKKNYCRNTNFKWRYGHHSGNNYCNLRNCKLSRKKKFRISICNILLKLKLPLCQSNLHFQICISAVHIIFMFHSIHGFRWTQQIGLLLVYGSSQPNWLEHCRANTDAMGWMLPKSRNFLRVNLQYHCDDHIFI